MRGDPSPLLDEEREKGESRSMEREQRKATAA
jgi:hypothetical protein